MRIQNPGISSNLSYFLFSFFIACLFLFVKGYYFNTGDQAEHLPAVYKMMDQELYPYDYYMQSASEVFTVRFFYTHLLYYLSVFFPLPAVCFVLTLTCLTLTAFSFMKITRELTIDLLAPYLAPLFILFVFYGFTVGGNYIQYPMLISSTLAKAIASYGLYCFFRKEYKNMALLLGIAALFQALVGLQLFLIVTIAWVTGEKRRNMRAYAGILLAFLVPASFMLGPVLYRQFFIATDYNKDLYYELLYVFRNPLHYLPSLFPLVHYIKTGILLLAGYGILLFARIRADKRYLHGFLAAIVLGLALYTFLLEYLDVSFIGKVQWFKTTIWLSMICSVLLAIVISRLIQLLVDVYIVLAYIRNIVAIGTLFLLVVMLNSAAIPVDRFQGKYQAGNYKQDDLGIVHEWIRNNTKKEAVFLYSPDNSSFACEAQRSSLIGYKAIIHEPFFLIPWYEKFSMVYDVSLDDAWEGHVLDKAVEQYRHRYFSPDELSYDYRIDNLSTCTYPDELGEEVFRKGNWVVTKARETF